MHKLNIRHSNCYVMGKTPTRDAIRFHDSLNQEQTLSSLMTDSDQSSLNGAVA